MKSQADERFVDRPQAPRWRRVVRVMIALGLFGPGCANQQLRFSTARQAQTVVDLEYQQILDNLAMFCLNRDAMPSLAILKTGATQVGDTGSLGFVGTAGLATPFGSSPTLSGTRTVVDQWGSSPMTDDNNLLLVRKAFRCALGYKDLLDEGDANDLAHDLSAQIGTTSDISVDQDTRARMHIEDLISDAMKILKTLDESDRSKILEISSVNCIEDELQRICDLENEIDRAADAFVKADLNYKLNLVRTRIKKSVESFPKYQEFDRLDSLAMSLAQARDAAGKYVTDTQDPNIFTKSFGFDWYRKINVRLFSLNI